MRLISVILFLFSFSAFGQNILILQAGQSNAYGGHNYGLTSVPSFYKSELDRVYVFNATATGYEKMNNSSSNNQFPNPNGYMSIELSLCSDLSYMGYDTVFFCEYAVSGALLYDSMTDNFNASKVGSYYDLAKVRFKSAKDYLINNGSTYDSIIFIWWQGESDARTSIGANLYHNNLTSFLTGMDNYINDTKYTTFIIRLCADIDTTTRYYYYRTIVNTQVDVANDLGYRIINSDAYECYDYAHFSSLDYMRFGQYIAWNYIVLNPIRYNSILFK